MKNLTRLIPQGLVLLLLAGVAVYVATHLQVGRINRSVSAAASNSPGALKVSPGPAELPDESKLQTVGENDRLTLKLDAKTAHFLVQDKKDGRVWRSYPNPAQWSRETTVGLWRTHLRSPLMFQYADLTSNKTQPKETNFLEEQGTIQKLETFPGGFRLTFDMPSKKLSVPIEVKLEGDSVVTRIVDSGIKEENLSLLWLRLYPFFGAERSEEQDGYLFIPDGSGALIRFQEGGTNATRLYQEPVFGKDLAYQLKSSNDYGNNARHKISAPVYGAKSGDRGFLAILEEGAEYADLLASPAGAYSTYNWITGQNNYRQKYRQVTNREKERSFDTYNKEARFSGDRVTRYVLLDSQASHYAGMAQRYRTYLMKAYKLNQLPPGSGKVPMDIIVVGGDSAKGLLGDRYVKATTTIDAMQMIQRLYGLGIDNMALRYWGWQKGGYGETGGGAVVDSRLGGEKGMKDLVTFAHSLNVPVYLRTDYSRNTSGAGGFSARVHGVRDLGGTPIEKFASLSFVRQLVDQDIRYFRELGVDGVELQGIGQYLSSDYNSKYGASRKESMGQQQAIITKLREGVGKVLGYRSSLFAAPLMDGVARLEDDFSNDLFSEDGIPFLQIALHGLVPYTSMPSNERDQFNKQFLRDLEYGANPSYLFTGSSSENLKYVQNLTYYSPSPQDWEQTAVQEFQKWNQALGDVQHEFITGHRILSKEVRETTFGNGKRIVVNYGTSAYVYEGRPVEPENYLVLQGGAKP